MSHEPIRKLPTDRAKEVALEAIRRGATVTGAAKAAGVDRRSIQLWRQKDEAFAIEFSEAWEEGVDVLEEAAFERAVKGTTRVTFDRGGNVRGEEIVFSDRLLELLLKAKRPGVYRERVSLDQRVTGDSEVLSRDVVRAAAKADPEAFERAATALNAAERARRDEEAK